MSRGTGFVVVTVAMSVFFLTAAPSASAAPPADACALVTPAQVSADVGVSVGAGTHVTPTYVKTCTWTATGSASGGSRTVTVSYQEAAAFAGAKQMMQQMAAMQTKKAGQAGLVNSSASGIGDDAFYSSMGGRYTALLVKKGDVSFKVAIYGELAMDKAQAMEKAIALQVLSKI